MSLPRAARERLAQPLRDAGRLARPLRVAHTLPVGEWAWSQHAGALADALDALSQLPPEPPEGFKAARGWVDHLLDARNEVVAYLLPLEPFAPFNTQRATRVLFLADLLPSKAATALTCAVPLELPVQELQDLASFWRTRRASGSDHAELLRTAFSTNDAPVDDRGEFRADWVLQDYAYDTGSLIQQVLPHLVSLGVPGVPDILAATSIVGWVLNCDDPVVAYIYLDSFVGHFYVADPLVARQASSHLDGREPALRRSRSAVSRAKRVALTESADTEERALALVDAYTRLLEGPFRQLSWALHCLKSNRWEAPPMLSSLRERLIAGGGNLSQIATNVVIPDLRNSEAHETLEWDGFAQEFVTETGRVGPPHVALALSLADSFVHGCEAGMVAVGSDAVELDESLPSPEQTGRMPNWRRVQAFFGTNRLRLTDAQLNTRNATLQVQRLTFLDINPCFQALILARRLLPDIETFAVGTPASETPLIEVSARALDAAMPAWEYAVTRLNQMPIATFLAANFDARLKLEPLSVAKRSVAWLAVDDLLDALHGSPDTWDDQTVSLLDFRFGIVELATEHTALLLESGDSRLASVSASATELRRWLHSAKRPGPAGADEQTVVYRLRTQWERWGPAQRHPLILEPVAPEVLDRPPALKEPSAEMHFRTL